MSGPRLKVLETIADVPSAQWNALLRPDDAPVLRWEWLHAMEASGSATRARGWEATHFTLWREDRLVAAAPAWRKHHSMGEYIYDFGWAQAAEAMGLAYHPKLLVGLPLSPLTARRFLVAAGEDETALRARLQDELVDYARGQRLSSIHVLFPPEAEAKALLREQFFLRTTLQYHWRNPGYRTPEDYLSRFDSKRRNQLKRERAAPSKQGITLRTLRSHELRPEHGELAWRFYEATASRYSWGPVQLTREFFHLVFETMRDAVELVVAERGGRVIAGAFNLHSPKRLYGRYWGCLEEHPFLHFNVCLYHSIDDAIARGLEAFEPGAGGEHKIARGFEPTAIYSVHRVFDPRFERAVKDFCRREGAQVAQLAAEGAAIAGLKPWPGPPAR
jgi:predicted N-acyltransferase